MLSVNDIVRVNVNVSQAVASESAFDVGLIMKRDENFTEAKRLQSFTSVSEALAWLTGDGGFSSTADICDAVKSYFGADPAPTKVLISCYPSSENAVDAYKEVLKRTNSFYGVCDMDVIGGYVSSLGFYIETSKHKKMFFCVGMGFYDNDASSSVIAGSQNPTRYFFDNGFRHTMTIDNFGSAYSHAIGGYYDFVGLMGLAMGMARTHRDSAFTLAHKTLKGVAAERHNQNFLDAIKSINGNVYNWCGNYKVLERGVTSSGMKYEDVLYIDMITEELQNAILNLITGSLVKLPQTDATTAMFISECNRVLERYYNMGVLATQPWRKAGIGNVANGDVIEHGYVCMADSYNNQSAEDRAAHNSMPITILLCLSGSVESIEITLNVQQ